MSDCVQSINVICKHVESNDTYYVDLAPRLGTSETVSSITSVTPSDANMTAASATVTPASRVSRSDELQTALSVFGCSRAAAEQLRVRGTTAR